MARVLLMVMPKGIFHSCEKDSRFEPAESRHGRGKLGAVLFMADDRLPLGVCLRACASAGSIRGRRLTDKALLKIESGEIDETKKREVEIGGFSPEEFARKLTPQDLYLLASVMGATVGDAASERFWASAMPKVEAKMKGEVGSLVAKFGDFVKPLADRLKSLELAQNGLDARLRRLEVSDNGKDSVH